MIFGLGVRGQTRLRREGRRNRSFGTLSIGWQKVEILRLARVTSLKQP